MHRALASLAAGVALVLASSPAFASSGPISLTVTNVTLTARVQVTVAFDVVCQPITDFANTDVIDASAGASIQVDQASGRTIAHASGGSTMPNGIPDVICDGSTVNHLSVSAISSTVPFHGGSAIVGVSVYVDDPACTFCGGGEYATLQAKANLK